MIFFLHDTSDYLVETWLCGSLVLLRFFSTQILQPPLFTKVNYCRFRICKICTSDYKQGKKKQTENMLLILPKHWPKS